jgi:hypothetical protein
MFNSLLLDAGLWSRHAELGVKKPPYLQLGTVVSDWSVFVLLTWPGIMICNGTTKRIWRSFCFPEWAHNFWQHLTCFCFVLFCIRAILCHVLQIWMHGIRKLLGRATVYRYTIQILGICWYLSMTSHNDLIQIVTAAISEVFVWRHDPSMSIMLQRKTCIYIYIVWYSLLSFESFSGSPASSALVSPMFHLEQPCAGLESKA